MDDAHLSALDRLSELIDGDQPVDPAELDGIPIEEAARQLLAAAAARHLLGGGAAPGDLVGPAVRAGIAAIRASEARARRRRRLAGVLVTAAALAVTAWVFAWRPSGLTHDLARLSDFVRSGLSRHYRVAFEPRSQTGGLLDLEVTLQGRSRYVANARLSLLGRQLEVVFGSDGKSHWTVPPELEAPLGDMAPVIVSSSGPGASWAEGMLGTHPLGRSMDRFESVFRIFDRLAQLERHYEVARTPTGGVRAERTATTPATWPDSITLSLSSTGAVAKIDLVFPPLPGGFGAPSLDRVHYTLVEELPLIDAYFRHDAHHAEDRPVRYVK